MAVVGFPGPTYLNPDNCLLTALIYGDGANYNDGTNVAANPDFASAYQNTLMAATVIDEGGNFITLRFTSIGLQGNYHINAASPAVDIGGGASLGTFAEFAADIDGQTRPQGAGVDMGVDVGHNDLNSRWRGGDNSWYDPYGEHGTPYDYHGHGTQTMGIIVGGDAIGSAIGVASDANWIAIKIFNDAGDANFSDIHLGFQWLLDPDGDPNTNDAPQVVNNSWGLIDNVNECILEFYTMHKNHSREFWAEMDKYVGDGKREKGDEEI